MATKAQLVSELAKLKKEFAALEDMQGVAQKAKNTADAEREKDDPAEISGKTKNKAKNGIEVEEPDQAGSPGDLQVSDIEGMTTQIMNELEGALGKKPLLIALGAFVVGYLIGRSR